MAGNVWEWTRSLWESDPGKPEYRYPYKPEDGRESLKAARDVDRVLRGGAFFDHLTGRAVCLSRRVLPVRPGRPPRLSGGGAPMPLNSGLCPSDLWGETRGDLPSGRFSS